VLRICVVTCVIFILYIIRTDDGYMFFISTHTEHAAGYSIMCDVGGDLL
jgi:hypothetical protein